MNPRAFDAAFPQPLLGMDEVGLGCIAGPIVVAGAVLPAHDRSFIDHLVQMGLQDSKQMTAPRREAVLEFLDGHPDVWLEVLQCGVEHKGVMWLRTSGLFSRIAASYTDDTRSAPATVLIDGEKRADLGFKHLTIVKGDVRSLTIAAASVAAKVLRDRWMRALPDPGYGFSQHKGYPTKQHKRALMRLGPSPVHRLWTRPVIAARRQHLEGGASA